MAVNLTPDRIMTPARKVHLWHERSWHGEQDRRKSAVLTLSIGWATLSCSGQTRSSPAARWPAWKFLAADWDSSRYLTGHACVPCDEAHGDTTLGGEILV